eukprot:1405566-Rhodomonas_salina.1
MTSEAGLRECEGPGPRLNLKVHGGESSRGAGAALVAPQAGEAHAAAEAEGRDDEGHHHK